MQELRGNLIEITDGLLIDVFDRIERGANAIAQHPQIAPSQVKRVAEELSPEMPQFKRFDLQVHNLSLSIATPCGLTINHWSADAWGVIRHSKTECLKRCVEYLDASTS